MFHMKHIRRIAYLLFQYGKPGTVKRYMRIINVILWKKDKGQMTWYYVRSKHKVEPYMPF